MGDINVAALEQKKKGKNGPNFKDPITYRQGGQLQLVQAEVLRRIYWRFKSKGRVARVAVSKKEDKKKSAGKQAD